MRKNTRGSRVVLSFDSLDQRIAPSGGMQPPTNPAPVETPTDPTGINTPPPAGGGGSTSKP